MAHPGNSAHLETSAPKGARGSASFAKEWVMSRQAAGCNPPPSSSTVKSRLSGRPTMSMIIGAGSSAGCSYRSFGMGIPGDGSRDMVVAKPHEDGVYQPGY